MRNSSEPHCEGAGTAPDFSVPSRLWVSTVRFLESSTAKPLLVVFAFALAFSFLKHAFLDPWDYMGGDFNLFYESAKKVADGESPYPDGILNTTAEESTGEAWGTYIYPPLFARILAPFTILPAFWAKKAYLLVCTVLYFWFLYPRASEHGDGRVGRVAQVRPGASALRWRRHRAEHPSG